MSSPSLSAFKLQQLYGLNRFSPDFHGQLCDILNRKEFVQCVPELQDHEVIRLIDYLDKVRRRIALPQSLLMPAQIVDGLDPSSDASRKCLRELRSICGDRAILPTSHTFPSDHLEVDSGPFAQGGFGDVHHGTLNGSKVCVKRMRMYVQGRPGETAKVRCWRRRSPYPPSLTKPTDVLSRGRSVETLDAPKHLTPPGCHSHSPTARFKLDVWWGPAGIPQEAPQCGPSWTCRCPSFCVPPMPYSSFQLGDAAKGLHYLHSCNVIHGDLKGVRGYSKTLFTTVLTPGKFNILVDDSNHARLADFGLAIITRGLVSIRPASSHRGHTVQWTAPEVLTGEKSSEESDIFSFAMVMIEVRRE